MSQAQVIYSNQKYEKLKNLLKELFQLDQPDLDFGLYRIMHAKSAEITQFLDNDLLPQVKEAFALYKSTDKAELEKELEKVAAGVMAAGMDPEQSPKVKELRDKLKNEAVDIGALENEVYDHLFNFFRRYYSEGDFLTKRVYKPGVYAIPYEGEEVKVHWANNDQYYIKTNEYLRDYSFSLRPAEKNPMRVHFVLADATEGEHGNIKAAEGKERVFVLASENFIAEKNGDLALRFEYRSPTTSDWPTGGTEGKQKPPSQKDLIAIAVKRIQAVTDGSLVPWLAELVKVHVNGNGETAGYTRLEAHLRRYVSKNTFDYFIHKDLGGFLRRELDFYIKNEMMHLDDVAEETAPRVEQYLSKVKVVRGIAGKFIDFLSQLEDFQKKLWLKKKFVVDTQYCVSLDRIPEQFYSDIAANDAQREEWVRLFAIDEIKGNLAVTAYSVPLTIEFLKANNNLLLDTRFFGPEFVSRLLERMDDLDNKFTGLLIHSENFQALRLTGHRYREQIKCIYIDPPYNTASSSIPYKNNYRHSSWATMMFDRLTELYGLLTKDGAIFVSIDKAERTILEHAMNDVFGADNRIEELIWSMNTNNSQAPNYSTNHEYVEVYARNRHAAEQDKSMFREPKPGYEEVMGLVERVNPSYPSVSEVESEIRALYENHRIEFREEIEGLGLDWEDEKANDPWKGLFNYDRAEYRDETGSAVPEAEAKARHARIWVWREDNISMPASKQAASTRDPNHRNWRFYNPPHPITGKPTPHPKSGWKYAYDDDADSPDRRSFVSLDRDNRIEWGSNETKIPQLKRFLHEVETNVSKSVFQDYSDGEKQTSAMFGKSGVFLAPKHASFVSRFILQAAKKDSTVLDCFGGSGSTAHAVIKLNREDGGQRRYILAEVGQYFDTVMKPRVLKAAYSNNWKSGRPITRDGISQCVKVMRLETYEDVLNNLKLDRKQTQQALLAAPPAQGQNGLKEQYLLRYMLDVEAEGSQSLLNIKAFSDPTAYKLKVKPAGSDESWEVNVDLLETFNWLIGLKVQHIAPPQNFTAEFERDSEKRLRLKGNLKLTANGPWWFRRVEGLTPDNRKTLIVWRKLTSDPEQDNLVLDVWMKDRLKISTKDFEFDLIYVNGGNNLENLRLPDDTWKVRLIEEDFHRLMFDTESL